MSRQNLITVLVVAGSLLFSGVTRGYDYLNETLEEETGWDVAGDGFAMADTRGWSEAYAWGSVVFPETLSGGAAYAYRDRRFYVTDYDPEVDPGISAYVSGGCMGDVDATGTLSSADDYYAEAAGTGYGAGLNCSAYIRIEEGWSGGYDEDGFERSLDVSHTGATVFYGDFAWATVCVYSARGWAACTAQGFSQTFVRVDEY